MRGILLRVGVVAAFIVGGLFLRQWLSGNAGDLKVGECFDVPAASEDIEECPASPLHGPPHG